MAASVLQRLLPLSIALLMLAPASCAAGDESPSAPSTTSTSMAAAPPAAQAAAPADATRSDPKGGEAPVTQRKIIRNAEMTLESRDPSAARGRAIQIVEQAGGYVANSTENRVGRGGDEWSDVHLTLKVPADKLSQVLGELRGLATRVSHEHIGSQDVTAEYTDLDARLRAQRAVELQLLEIAKEAKSVKDLLEVQRQLGEVRGEVERLEGRRRQIDHQVSLSTVQLTLRREGTAADPTLAGTIKKAGADAVAVSSGILHGSIRAVGVLLPVAIIFSPLLYLLLRLGRWLHARASRA